MKPNTIRNSDRNHPEFGNRNCRFPGTTILPGFAFFSLLVCCPVLSQAWQGCVHFDVPSHVQACDVSDIESMEQLQRLVELIIPVSSMVGCDDDQRVLEMTIHVRGLGKNLQVVNYAPRTQMYSDVDGTIAVEQRIEKNATLGVDASGTAGEIVKLNGRANAGSTKSNSKRFQQIPEQKLLLASGTIERGKGAYFKYRHSPQTTLEGGHEIVLTLRVPDTWRGGMLRVDCQASGKEKYLLGESNFSAGNNSFVVATYLKGDIDAQKIVETYGNVETRIRQMAAQLQQAQEKKSSEDPIGHLLGYHESDLPDGWSDRFMLYDSKSIQSKLRPHLSAAMQKATDQFLESRQTVLRLAGN